MIEEAYSLSARSTIRVVEQECKKKSLHARECVHETPVSKVKEGNAMVRERKRGREREKDRMRGERVKHSRWREDT